MGREEGTWQDFKSLDPIHNEKAKKGVMAQCFEQTEWTWWIYEYIREVMNVLKYTTNPNT